MDGRSRVIYYATASGPGVTAAMCRGQLGQMRTPDTGNRLVPGARWAADNGCFNAKTFTIARWGRWLIRQPRTADWATVPDVVGDHAATLARWHRFAGWVRRIGFRPAFVAQNGCTPNDIPDDAGALFIGGIPDRPGGPDWKLSNAAHACALEARRRGIPVHMGRVNSLRRLRIAAQWECDSVDGTLLAFGPDIRLPQLLSWLEPDAPSLFGVA